MLPLMPNTARWMRPPIIVGILIILLSLIAASKADEAWQITLSLGLFSAIGGNTINHVHVTVFSEWWDRRRTEAMSYIWVGYRLGALAFPLIVQLLLESRGWHSTLKFLIAPIMVLLVPSVFLLRGRFPAASVVSKSIEPPISRLTAIKTGSVPFFLLATMIYIFVTNVPKIFVARYAADLTRP